MAQERLADGEDTRAPNESCYEGLAPRLAPTPHLAIASSWRFNLSCPSLAVALLPGKTIQNQLRPLSISGSRGYFCTPQKHVNIRQLGIYSERDTRPQLSRVYMEASKPEIARTMILDNDHPLCVSKPPRVTRNHESSITYFRKAIKEGQTDSRFDFFPSSISRTLETLKEPLK